MVTVDVGLLSLGVMLGLGLGVAVYSGGLLAGREGATVARLDHARRRAQVAFGTAFAFGAASGALFTYGWPPVTAMQTLLLLALGFSL